MSSERAIVVLDVGRVVLGLSMRSAMAEWRRRLGFRLATMLLRLAGWDGVRRHEVGLIDGRGLHAEICERVGQELTFEDFVAGWNALLTGPLPGAVELVRELAGRGEVHALSNTNDLHRERFVSEWPELFAPLGHLACSHELGCRKPEARIYDAFCEQVGARPEQLIFFDDRPENVAAARDAGWQAEVATGPAAVRRALVRRRVLPG